MPLYEYQCDEHGVFDAFGTFSESDRPNACPTCGTASPRVLSIPRVALVESGTRKAMDRNEKSRHDPHVCRSGCGCRGPQPKAKQDPESKPKLHSYNGPRPWVVEHA